MWPEETVGQAARGQNPARRQRPAGARPRELGAKAVTTASVLSSYWRLPVESAETALSDFADVGPGGQQPAAGGQGLRPVDRGRADELTRTAVKQHREPRR